ncbi:MAG: alkane 1-monooxygenase [Thermodesulfobacteriota bacterium]
MWSFTLVYLVPISVIAGTVLGGWYTFLTPLMVFGVVPILDVIIGRETNNPSGDELRQLETRVGYRIVTWICAPLQVLLVFWACRLASGGGFSVLEYCGMAASVGVSSGVMGINVAHELAHRVNEKMEPLLSKIMLCTVCYMHWGLEHVVGHHRRVATQADPATARFGESFYAFWPRTVFGGFGSAFRFEAERLRRNGLGPWNLRNRVASGLLLQSVLILFVAIMFGWKGLIFFILQAFIAISLLEIVNYVEHYGLFRREIPGNRHEPVTPLHSWNSSNWLTNRFLFNLQRHSDHHYKPGRRYQALRHFEESPQLPTGYAGMVLLAAVPPLWRAIMDRRVAELHRQRSDKPIARG